MNTPDPYENRGLVLLYPAIIGVGQDVHPRYPGAFDIQFKYSHWLGDKLLEESSVTINENGKHDNGWELLIESLNLCWDATGPNTLCVSIHNLSLIQRAAWWWSRKNQLPDPAWNNNHIQQDMVNLFHGPAIITAEERFSFNTLAACHQVGIDAYSSTNRVRFHADVDYQFECFTKLWGMFKS